MSPITYGMLALLIVITGVAARRTTPRSAWCAVIIGLSTFVPLVSAPTSFCMALAAIALVGLLTVPRTAPAIRPLAVDHLLIAMLVYMQVARVVGGQAFARDVSITVCAVVLAVLARRVGPSDLSGFMRVVNCFVLFHLTYAVFELFGGLAPIWPMGDGRDGLEYRPNFLLPDLPGRAMTSFAHPNPLGLFAVFAMIGSLALALRSLQRRWFVAVAISGSLILLSGTRSAVLAGVFAALLLTLKSRRLGASWKSLGSIITLGLASIAVLNPGGVLRLVGLGEGFSDSNSYTYRLGVLNSATNLLSQPPFNVVFGWGGNRQLIYENRVVGESSFGVLFFDNQFVASAAMYGLVGFALYTTVLVLLLRSKADVAVAWGLVLLAMSFTFDLLQFSTPLLLFVFAAAFRGSGSSQGKFVEPRVGEFGSRDHT